MKRAFFVAVLIACLLYAISPAQTQAPTLGQTAASPQGLKFFANYFLTGDYVVAGVGLRGKGGVDGSPAGLATGTITISDVPPSADVMAAFLYWQVVSKDSLGPDSGAVGATFGALGGNTYPLSSADGPFSKVLDRAGSSPCWSSGGGTGGGGGTHRTYSYRADVRRFLNVDDNDRFIANGTYVVQVPDSGPSGNGVPIALGASLVVIYRVPEEKFSAIVLYDGGLTIDNSNKTYDLTIKGFYQPNASDAKITYVVGSGQGNKYENLYFYGAATTPLLGMSPFDAHDGPSWDTRTYENVVLPSGIPQPPYGATVTTRIDTAGLNGSDCLTPAMVAFKTEVKDTDSDGLLDLWETTSGLKDPNDHVLPDLPAMLANPGIPDLFVQIDYMRNGEDTYGGVDKPAHNHMPVSEALKKAGDAFTKAGITPHFDVGSPEIYHTLGPEYAALVGPGDSPTADDYLVRATLARGGHAIEERVVDEEGAPCSWPDCQFPDYPGTVGWKVGFRSYRDKLLSASPPALVENPPGSGSFDDPCDGPVPGDVESWTRDGSGGACERRFDRNRKHMFRYLLGAHFVGLPKSELPCLDVGGSPVPASPPVGDGPVGLCSGPAQAGFTAPVKDNPLFHVPRTVSGIADFPGADLMLTLGGFSDAAGRPVGTPYMQAGTLMHELGHTFDLGHGGVYLSPSAPEPPNCNPNYLSVMNYLFQLRGLFNETNPGIPQADYSYGEISLLPIDESSPADVPWSASYFTGWYAPQAAFPRSSPVTRHCTGTKILPEEPLMVRVDGPLNLGGTISWGFGVLMPAGQDINFDGLTSGAPPLDPLGVGSNDWETLRLNLLASRRNVLGMSLEVGRDGIGRGETVGRDGIGRDGIGRDGIGRDGIGRDGIGRDGIGRDGIGRDGIGRDGIGRDGIGRDGIGHDWLGRDVNELDAELAAASGNAPPTGVTAGFVPNACAGSTPELCHRIKVDFGATPVNPDTVVLYHIYRFRTDGTEAEEKVGAVPGTVFSTIDMTELPNAKFTYYVIAEFDGEDPESTSDNFFSGPSNFFTVLAVNDRPAAQPDEYSVDQGATLNVGVPGVLGNDKSNSSLPYPHDLDSPSLTAALVSGPKNGTLEFLQDGSFTYTPSAGFFGTDTFSYTAEDKDPKRASNAVTVTIAVHDVTAPIVSLTIPTPTGSSGYFKGAPVWVSVSATDLSGVSLLSCTDNDVPVLLPASGRFTVDAQGTHNLVCTAIDGAGNVASNVGQVKIDSVAPTITITTPAAGATYFINASIASNYSCSDSVSGLATCLGKVPFGSNFDTTLGGKTFWVEATDKAGNSARQEISYSVGYNVTLTPIKSTATLGSAVPVIWQVKDGSGGIVSDLKTVDKITSVWTAGPGCVASTTGTPEVLYSDPNGSTGKSTLRFVSPNFQFNWDTTTTTTAPIVTGKGCYTVLIYLKDAAASNPRITTPVQLK